MKVQFIFSLYEIYFMYFFAFIIPNGATDARPPPCLLCSRSLGWGVLGGMKILPLCLHAQTRRLTLKNAKVNRMQSVTLVNCFPAAVQCGWSAVIQQAVSACCPWMTALWRHCLSGRLTSSSLGYLPSPTGTRRWFIQVTFMAFPGLLCYRHCSDVPHFTAYFHLWLDEWILILSFSFSFFCSENSISIKTFSVNFQKTVENHLYHFKWQTN